MKTATKPFFVMGVACVVQMERNIAIKTVKVIAARRQRSERNTKCNVVLWIGSGQKKQSLDV